MKSNFGLGFAALVLVSMGASPAFARIEESLRKIIFDNVERLEIDKRPVELALDYYDTNAELITNKDFIVVIDMNRVSWEKRFALIDMKTGAISQYLAAHGEGSDPDDDGMATRFSNTLGSHQTALGFYLTAETYDGANGYSLRLDGLESSNDMARPRAIVVHGATYVREGIQPIGRSQGCPALAMNLSTSIIDKIKFGSLLFIYHEQYE